jgi:predicted DNA-binding protein (UPF0251 family)
MARIKKYRKIQRAPHFSGFKPYGSQKAPSGEVMLHFEEYEAIKLCDYEKLHQAEASRMMNISRPTFTRVYRSARQKIARALVECAVITIEGGKVIYDIEWYSCASCHITFSLLPGTSKQCPFCGSVDIKGDH